MEPVILSQYIAPGNLKLEFRDFPFRATDSKPAAEASRCAADQGQFWAYHDLDYYNQDNPSLPGLTRPTLNLFAEHLGLDMTAFSTCMDDHTHLDEVNQEYADGQALGIAGTPSFQLNGELVTGFQTYGELFDAIEQKIAEAGTE